MPQVASQTKTHAFHAHPNAARPSQPAARESSPFQDLLDDAAPVDNAPAAKRADKPVQADSTTAAPVVKAPEQGNAVADKTPIQANLPPTLLPDLGKKPDVDAKAETKNSEQAAVSDALLTVKASADSQDANTDKTDTADKPTGGSSVPKTDAVAALVVAPPADNSAPPAATQGDDPKSIAAPKPAAGPVIADAAKPQADGIVDDAPKPQPGTAATDTTKQPPAAIVSDDAKSQADAVVADALQKPAAAAVAAATTKPAPPLPQPPAKPSAAKPVQHDQAAGDAAPLAADDTAPASADAPKQAAAQAAAQETVKKFALPDKDASPADTRRAAVDKPVTDISLDAAKPDDATQSLSVAAATSQPASSAASASAAAAPAAPAAAQAAAVPLAGLAVEIAGQALTGKNRFEIRLDPPELGRIEVRLDVDKNGGVTSHLIADRADTLDLLRRDASGLERALQDAGLKTSDNSLQFSLRDQSGQQQQEHQQSTAARLVVTDDSVPAAGAAASALNAYASRRGGIDIRV